VVSLHCPLVPATERLVNPATLARMKPGAYLINVARGGLVDEEALTAALVERRLAGVGLDVLGVEPPVEKEPSPLLRAPRCLITPHLAWAARSARERLLREVAENLRVFQAGVPRNAVG
jgi:glycerate dehydrogenase